MVLSGYRTPPAQRRMARSAIARDGQSPAPNAAHVDVNEVGLGVVADASALHGESGITYLRGGHAGNADVDGLSFHVLAVLGDSVAVLTEVVIAPWRAVAADNVNHAVRMAEPGHQVVE